MDTQTIVLAVVQGLTEFLPISSSAHLILVPRLLGWPDQGLGFDIAVHVGTLFAVVLYFRKEVTRMLKDWLASIFSMSEVGESRLAWAVVIGTIPAGIAGILLKDLVEHQLRSPLIIATSTIVFGLLLWFADWSARQMRDEQSVIWKDALIVGLMQALALIPGTSRSGITITAGLMLGLTRTAAARFSFLLSIPLIAAAGLFKAKDLAESTLPVNWVAIIVGTVLSAIAALMCIHLFLKLLERVGMLPFILYRLVLGVFLFWVFV